MPKAIIYCRVSSDRQVREGHGLDGQESRCRKYAIEKGYQILAVFRDEGISGGVVERDGMQELLAFLNKHRDGNELVVVIDDIKRLARDVMGHFTLKKSIQAAGARLESPSHRFGEAPEEIFVESIMAATAELERNQNKQQVRNRMQARLEAGYWLFNAPAGYKFALVKGHGKMLVPKESECRYIREAFEGYASGRFETRADVQRFLQSHEFVADAKRSSSYIHGEFIHRLLTNEVYAGYISYPPWNVTRRKAQHRPIVDPRTFQKVQDRLRETANSKRHPDSSKDFPLRGFVLCSSCRKPYTASWCKGMTKAFAYYRCNSKGCSEYNRSVSAIKMHNEFEALLGSLKPRAAVMEYMKTRLSEFWTQQRLNVEMVCKERQRKLDAIDEQIQQFLGAVGKSRNATVLSKLEEEIDALEAKKLRLGDHIDRGRNHDFDRTLKLVFDFLQDPLIKWQNGQLSQKRMVMRLVFREALVYVRKVGFETPQLSQPIEVSCLPELDQLELVDPTGQLWNSWIELIQQWAELLGGSNIDHGREKGWRWSKLA